MIGEGDKAPEFALSGVASGGEEVTVSLADFEGRTVVVYFYPKDNTSGCTTQACGIRDEWPAFEGTNAVILGVSPDDEASHRKFSDKYDLPFTLLSDPDHAVSEAYGVWKEKNMYGRKYMGIERSTFIIDADGVIQHAWRRVRAKEHADKVLEALA